jgi:hypothetical protein
MPTIMLQADRLNAATSQFSQTPLRQPLFLNSVPKSGSHLLRNIIRMFVPVEQQYQVQFIQWRNLHEHLVAFDPRRNCLSWGHMLFSDISAVELAHVCHILLVRDPYDWVLARARFHLSDAFHGEMDHLKRAELGIEALLNMMIFGIHEKVPPLAEAFAFNAVAWLGTGVHIVRYEDLLRGLDDLEGDAADACFGALLETCGIDRPTDWRERVRIGADRRQSGTARENLTGAAMVVPDELPAMQKRLIDYAAPGLRALLGYT